MLANLRAKRILVVEDDITFVAQINEILRRAGYDVQNAYNCGDAVAADHARFSLALVNPTMHDRDGRSIEEHIEALPSFRSLPRLNLNEAVRRVQGKQVSAVEGEKLVLRIGQVLNIQNALPISTDPDATIYVNRAAPTDQRLRVGQYLAALKTLSDLARTISSVLDLTEVLNQIVEAATTLTNAEEGMLLLPDDEEKALYLRAMKGVDDATVKTFRIRNEDNLVATVYRTGQPILVGDRGPLRVKTEYFAKSILYVPMVIKGRCVGVLGVNNRFVDRTFSRSDQELLLDLAAHAAIAIENAQLYESTIRQNRNLQRLVEGGMAVNSTLSLDETLATICQQIIESLNVHMCLISYAGDMANHALTPLAVVSRMAWHSNRAPQVDLSDRAMLRQALERNGFYIVQHDEPADMWQEEIAHFNKQGATGIVVIPIRANGQMVIGSLELYYRGDIPEVTSEFRVQSRALGLTLCTLFTDTESTHGSVMNSNIISTADRILSITGANWFTLSLWMGDHSVRLLEYGSAVFVDAPYAERLTFPPDMLLNAGEMIAYTSRQHDRPEIIDAMMGTFHAESVLCLPLLAKGQILGMVTVLDTGEPRKFSTEEISLLRGMVTQAGIALENARLYHDLERSHAELKATQTALVQAARLTAMGELAAVVAHQINNPLTTIMVDSELLMQDIPSNNPMRESVNAIHRAGQRAYAVVKRLLSTARRSSPDDNPEWLDAHQTLRNTLELVTTHIERSKIRLEVELDPRPGYVFAPPGHLEDVWLNLLLNARDALAGVPNAHIQVHSQITPTTLEIGIRDNGAGIPSEYVSRIFEPFFTTKAAGDGTGLGLYICKQVIERCNGNIALTSEPGKGTLFTITLPTRHNG
jgi:signal transduction histidine kinase/CheY-like chemotaxis protein